MNKNEQALTKPIIIIVSLILAIVLTAIFYEPILLAIGKVSVVSAKTYLPQECVSFDSVDTFFNPVNATTAQITTDEPTTKESTTKAVTTTTPKTTKAEKVETVYKTIISQEDFAKTPDDVAKLISAAKKTASTDKKDGSIVEKHYTNDGATDKSENVYVKNVNETQINVKELIEKKADLSVTKDKPSVLIYHSHTTESFQYIDRDFYATNFLSRDEDLSRNMVRVGDEICSELEKAGYIVIHDTKIHDLTYSKSYANSKESIISYLKKYPTIEVAIDVHRDAIQTDSGVKYKPTTEVYGKKSAQIMLIAGCQEEGNSIEDFNDWKYNLIFALDFQKKAQDLFGEFARPLYFSPRKYNMNLTRNSFLLEVGSDANTLEEAVYAGKCCGVALVAVLDDYLEK